MHPPPHPTDIEWYRPGLLLPVVAIWSVGCLLMSVGVLACAVALDNSGRVPVLWARVAGVVGGVGTLGGALVGLLGILRVLTRQTACLVLRVDGVVLQEDGEEERIAWEALRGCRNEGRALILEHDAGELVIRHRFMGTTPEMLSSRILEVQRQALMGVLEMKLRHRLPVGGVPSGS